MAMRNIESILNPASVAVIGASPRLSSVGGVLVQNLLHGGYKGKIFLVNPKHHTIEGIPVYSDVPALPGPVDLAIIATPPETVPGLIQDLGIRGVRAAAVVTAGHWELQGPHREQWNRELLQAAQPHSLRILGPNTLGVMAAGSNLNASLAHMESPRGQLAFVAQSGSVLTTVLDWAAPRGIGFSHLVSLGDMADVDFGDMLDYLTGDTSSRAILLHVEAVTQARKFMSAARAAARVKPVLVVKTGRHAGSARGADLHTGAQVGTDAVYDAAFRRAGMLRVQDLHELFAAVETLAVAKHAQGNRLVILTNGGGLGVIAADALADEGGIPAELSPETLARLDAILPAAWSRSNPVDLLDDSTPSRMAQALAVLLEDKGHDGVLILNAPNSAAASTQVAEAVVETLKSGPTRARTHAVLTCWPGGQTARDARSILEANRLPTYETPHDAIRGFMHGVRYRRNQEMLMETPSDIPDAFTPNGEEARRVILQALSQGCSWLTASEAKAVLSAYCIPVVPTLFAATPEDAAALCAELRPPVALKILSPDIQRKSEVCGVALHLDTPEAVRETAQAMAECVRSARPDARLSGFAVQPMVHRLNAHELMVGALDDPRFGPAVFFGHGGIAADAIQDKAFGLPPLNMHLAREVMSRTRIHRTLQGRGGMPPSDTESVALTLVKVSQLLCDHPEVAELEINPLLVDACSVLALDARIRIAEPLVPAARRLCIRPYPGHLEETLTLPDGQTLLIRPIRPEDEPAYQRLFSSLSQEDIRMRFLHPMQTLSHSLAARLTQIDYDREMALIITNPPEGSCPGDTRTDAPLGPVLHGGVRIMAEPDNERAEFAIMLHPKMTGLGLGPMLMRRIIDYAQSQGIGEIYGDVLSENRPMLSLCKALRFTSRRDPDDPGVIVVSLKLRGD